MEFPIIEEEVDFEREVWEKIKASPADCLFVIHDKFTGPKADDSVNIAGLISLTGTNPQNAVTEMGVLVFPEFHRTHVATNAIGLLLQWTLDSPSAGGLGLRRVEWKTHVDNAASQRTALRMGFESEGICRWERVISHGKNGLSVEGLEKRNGTEGGPPGRHTAIYSIVWDEWDDKRSKAIAQMERRR